MQIGVLVDFSWEPEDEEDELEVVSGESLIYRFSVENNGNGKMIFYVNETSIPEGWDASISKNEFELNRNDKKALTITLTHDPQVVTGTEYDLSFTVQSVEGEPVDITFSVTLLKGEGTSEESEGMPAWVLPLIALILLGGAGAGVFVFMRTRE